MSPQLLRTPRGQGSAAKSGEPPRTLDFNSGGGPGAKSRGASRTGEITSAKAPQQNLAEARRLAPLSRRLDSSWCRCRPTDDVETFS
jgi:hypothetical protein